MGLLRLMQGTLMALFDPECIDVFALRAPLPGPPLHRYELKVVTLRIEEGELPVELRVPALFLRSARNVDEQKRDFTGIFGELGPTTRYQPRQQQGHGRAVEFRLKYIKQ